MGVGLGGGEWVWSGGWGVGTHSPLLSMGALYTTFAPKVFRVHVYQKYAGKNKSPDDQYLSPLFDRTFLPFLRYTFCIYNNLLTHIFQKSQVNLLLSTSSRKEMSARMSHGFPHSSEFFQKVRTFCHWSDIVGFTHDIQNWNGDFLRTCEDNEMICSTYPPINMPR